MFNNESEYPFFVEGIYDVLFMNGRGGIYGGDYTKSLEHHACMLFNVDQTKRKTYRQTGYFVSGYNCHNFLEEWYSMCSNIISVEPSYIGKNTNFRSRLFGRRNNC